MGNKDITQATPSYQLCHIVEQGDQVVQAGRELDRIYCVQDHLPPQGAGTKPDSDF